MNDLVKHLKYPVLTIFLALVLIYGFSALFGPIPFSVKSTTTMNNDLFTVSGTGEEKATADKATFTVGVAKTAATAEAGTEQVNTSMNAIIESLKALGIKDTDIKTQNLTSYPNQDFTRGSTVTGFTVSEDLQVTADSIDLANQALDAAVSKGANQINGVTFTVNDADKKSLEQKARKKAIEDAKSKAQDIAKDAGIRLGKVVNIYVSDNNGMNPVPMFDAKAANAGEMMSAPTNLQAGENTVSVTVTLSYETL